jgi:hypothetical protein
MSVEQECVKMRDDDSPRRELVVFRGWRWEREEEGNGLEWNWLGAEMTLRHGPSFLFGTAGETPTRTQTPARRYVHDTYDTYT